MSYGTGVSGDASVVLGGTLNIQNTGVTELTAGNGINIDQATGGVTITNNGLLSATAGAGIDVTTTNGAATIANTGVTSLTGTANQVIVDQATGGVTLSLPQDIHNNASPTFDGLTLDNINNASAANQIVVSNNGAIESRSFNSLFPGGLLPGGTSNNSTLRWDGTNWVENTAVTADGSGNTTLGGDLTVNGANVNLPNGSVDNAELANASVNLSYGTGVSGEASVVLGGTLNLQNTGVTALAAGNGINVDQATGAVTITNNGLLSATAGAGIDVTTTNGAATIANTGVTSLTGTGNQVIVDQATGGVRLSLPQDIHNNASPTFDGLTLDNINNASAANQIVVSNNGTIESRSFNSFFPGGLLPGGTSNHRTLRWDGTSWVENTTVTADGSGNINANGNTTLGGDLTVNGTNVNLPNGSIDNAELANASVNISYGTGVSGHASVALGGTLNLQNTGVTELTAGNGINVDQATGSITITNNGLLSATAGAGIDVTTTNGAATIANTGVTSLTGTANQVIVDQATGGVMLSLPQDIHSNASPTFDGLTLDNINNASAANQIVVSNNGAIESRSFNSLFPGGLLPGGTSNNSTLRWDGTNWVENTTVTADGSGNINVNGNATLGGDLTVNGTNVSLPNGSVDNAELANASVNVSYGTGVSGDASVVLGGTLNIQNTGVTALAAGNGINVDQATGAVTITNNGLLSATAGAGIDVTTTNGAATIANTGVTSLTGTANQVTVDQATGGVTLSLPQDIHSNASPTFDGLTLDNINNASAANQIVVSNNGAIESRSFNSLFPGGLLPGGTSNSSTLRWDGTNWIENTAVTTDGSGNINANGNTTLGGDLTVNGANVNLPNGSIDNAELANASINVSYGTGLNGDASVTLGGTLNLQNTGVTALTAGNGINVDQATGGVTITNNGLLSATAGAGIDVTTTNGAATIANTGVTSLTGTGNQVIVDQAMGGVTLSLPQDIHSNASPTFDGLTLDNINNASAANQIVVSNNGAIESRSFNSLFPGGLLPGGTSNNSTLRWDGTNWVENTTVTADGSGNINANGNATLGGDLTVNGANVNLPNGSIDNAELANASVNISYGTGISGDASVVLGGTLNLQNTGVTALTAGNGINVDQTTGAVTITNNGLLSATAGAGIDVTTTNGAATIANTGVTSLTGTANQVIVDQATGGVTLSLPQDIHNNASPTFDGLTLDNINNASAANQIVVSNNGAIESRSFNSLFPGGLLPGGTSNNSTLRWDGTNWIENTTVTADGSGNINANGNATLGGDLTVNGANANLPNGSIDNTELANASVNINYGTGVSGDASVALGGTLNLQNTGVTALTAGNGINVDQATGNVTITNNGLLSATAGAGIDVTTTNGAATIANTGVTSLTGTANQVIVDQATGGVTLSLPQDIHSNASPTFDGLTLDNLTGASTSTEMLVSNAGSLETRTFASLLSNLPLTTNAMLVGNGSNVAAELVSTNDEGAILQQNASGTPVWIPLDTLVSTVSDSLGANLWLTSGNTGTNPASNFIGTIDSTVLVVRVNNDTAMRIIPDIVPSIIGGSYTNSVVSISFGSVIGGGNANRVDSSVRSVIAGGDNNEIRNFATNGVIGGGYSNLIDSSAKATISGGHNNEITTYSLYSTVGGGLGNIINSSVATTIGGGWNNEIKNDSRYSTIAGGLNNDIDSSQYATVTGGSNHHVSGSSYGIVSGGRNHTVDSSNYGTISGGSDNIIAASLFGVIGGGWQNTVDTSAYAVHGGGLRNRTGASNYSVLSGGRWHSVQNSNEATISGGSTDTILNSPFSTVGGGTRNRISDFSTSATIAGGSVNVIEDADYGTITGGLLNTITNSNYSTVAGGRSHTVDSSEASTIAGGRDNIVAASLFGVIGGGWQNTVNTSAYAVHGGGWRNQTGASNYSVLSGGRWNLMQNSNEATISGGSTDTILNSFIATISGGTENVIHRSTGGTIAGGRSNYIDSSSYGTISGGISNNLNISTYSTISGGSGNDIDSSAFAGILSGRSNTLDSATYSTIVGGSTNTISGSTMSTISGGNASTMISGLANTISGGYNHQVHSSTGGTIGGGYRNRLDTTLYSTIGGGILHVIGKTTATTADNVIAGGRQDTILNSTYSAIGGGLNNAIDSSTGATIVGGVLNRIESGGTYSSILGGRGLVLQGNKSTGFHANQGLGLTDAEIDEDNVAFFGNVDMWLGNNRSQASKLKFFEAYNTTGAFPGTTNYYSSFEAGNQSDTIEYILPTTAGTAGDVLEIASVTGDRITLEWDTDDDSSDRRFKKNIRKLSNALDSTLMLRGVRHGWRREEFKNRNFPEHESLGFIAQEVEQVFPELVETKSDGYKKVQYAKITALLVEALREQHTENNLQEERINQLEQENQEIRAMLKGLQETVNNLRTSENVE